jgi:diguanylate cyclase (GGDEF)-like protein
LPRDVPLTIFGRVPPRGGSIAMRQPRFTDILRFGVRQKVILVLLTVLIAGITLSSWLLFRHQSEQIKHESVQNNELTMRYVSRSLAFSVVGYDYHTIQLLLDEIIKFEDIVYARVLSPKGNVMAEAGTPPGESDASALLTSPIELDGQTVGSLIMGISNARIIAEVNEQRNLLIKRELFIIILIAIGEFLALSYLIIRPITTISRALTTNEEDAKLIDRDIPIHSRDEFGDMAARFNLMRRRLNEAHEKLRSRIIAADQELQETNRKLIRKSHRLRRANEQLRKLSITDGLTGLFNRRHLESLLRSAVNTSLRYGEHYSVILIDLDRFKRVNDRFGHDAGDMVLKETATLLKGITRNSDTVCRVGGEEFVVVCKHTDAETSIGIAEKIRSRLETTPMQTEYGTITLTASIGIATIPDKKNAQDAEMLMRNADMALYYCKRTGRNRIAHHRDLPQQEQDMRRDFRS